MLSTSTFASLSSAPVTVAFCSVPHNFPSWLTFLYHRRSQALQHRMSMGDNAIGLSLVAFSGIKKHRGACLLWLENPHGSTFVRTSGIIAHPSSSVRSKALSASLVEEYHPSSSHVSSSTAFRPASAPLLALLFYSFQRILTIRNTSSRICVPPLHKVGLVTLCRKPLPPSPLLMGFSTNFS